MTKNHFNGKKSIFQVFLGYAVKNSKKFPDQDHTVENLLRSGITDFRDVPRFSSYLTRYTHTMQLLLFSLIHQVSVPTFTPKFHSSAVTQYTITYTFVLNDLSLSEHMVEFFSMQQNLT